MMSSTEHKARDSQARALILAAVGVRVQATVFLAARAEAQASDTEMPYCFFFPFITGLGFIEGNGGIHKIPKPILLKPLPYPPLALSVFPSSLRPPGLNLLFPFRISKTLSTWKCLPTFCQRAVRHVLGCLALARVFFILSSTNL